MVLAVLIRWGVWLRSAILLRSLAGRAERLCRRRERHDVD
jgi:hypothetical protein